MPNVYHLSEIKSYCILKMAEQQLLDEAHRRLLLRREDLKQSRLTVDVKNHERLEKYFQMAHLVLKQSEVYYLERDFDHA